MPFSSDQSFKTVFLALKIVFLPPLLSLLKEKVACVKIKVNVWKYIELCWVCISKSKRDGPGIQKKKKRRAVLESWVCKSNKIINFIYIKYINKIRLK